MSGELTIPTADTVFEGVRLTLHRWDCWPSLPPSAMVQFSGKLLNTRQISLLEYFAQQCLTIVIGRTCGNRWPASAPKAWAFCWGNYRHKEFLEAYQAVVRGVQHPPPPVELQPLSPELRELADAQRESGK